MGEKNTAEYALQLLPFPAQPSKFFNQGKGEPTVSLLEKEKGCFREFFFVTKRREAYQLFSLFFCFLFYTFRCW